ncbi:MAG: hypothetical protein EB037_12860 [Actinobacteria bacterium]|nr:hypothetical protein [Actinomycetota bacterium]
MAIFVNQNTKVIVQGLTGGQGKYHGLRNKAYGTQVVGGVTPGKGGTDVEGIPVFNTVAEAVAATGADASFIAVPPKAASAAILEAAAAGIRFVVCITEFQADPETDAIIMIGEIGGSAEEEAAEFIKANVTKPMSAYIAGVTAPAGKKMGHAGAIVSGGKGTAQGKMDALRAAGVKVGQNPTEAGDLMAEIIASIS